MTLKELQERVRQFHLRNGLFIGKDRNVKDVALQLSILAGELRKMSESALRASRHASSSTMFRAHLKLEELSEQLQAEAEGKLLKTCDAIGDQIYVLAGDCVTRGLPLQEIVEEVCRSNDTKEFKVDPHLSERRDKGPNFQPPNMAGALRRAKFRLR